MSNPFVILGIPETSDDAIIRKRYLELIQKYSPEHYPARFAAIRAAYEQIKDRDTRLTQRLFEAGQKDNLTDLLEEMECQITRTRVPLQKLITLLRR